MGTLMGTAHRLDNSSSNYNESPLSLTLPTNNIHHVSMVRLSAPPPHQSRTLELQLLVLRRPAPKRGTP